MSTPMVVIFIIMILEGLNLTGIPAIVILPTVGVLAAQGVFQLGTLLVVAIVGSVVGNVIYYCVVIMIGPKIYDKLYEKFKGIRKSLDKANALVERHGNKACCIGRMIPGARTVISLMAGTFKVNFVQFTLYSTVGIVVWNGVLIVMGYLLAPR